MKTEERLNHIDKKSRNALLIGSMALILGLIAFWGDINNYQEECIIYKNTYNFTRNEVADMFQGLDIPEEPLKYSCTEVSNALGKITQQGWQGDADKILNNLKKCKCDKAILVRDY